MRRFLGAIMFACGVLLNYVSGYAMSEGLPAGFWIPALIGGVLLVRGGCDLIAA